MDEVAGFDVHAVAVDVGVVVVAVEDGAGERPVGEVLVGFEAAVPGRIVVVGAGNADEATEEVAVVAGIDVANEAVGRVGCRRRR